MTANVPKTIEEFMAQALAMEREAAQRYNDFADAMEMHNNHEVAKLFRTMAGYETKHAQEIMAEMNWSADPVVPANAWPSMEPPEVVPNDEVHYLMHPWHALQLALAAEQRAEAYFDELARAATTDSVRRAALQLKAEEAEHVQLVQAWLNKTPKPDDSWADDPDPPRYTE
ncbi:MAG: ferritin family protein [Ideonella sp.]|nr:ferritin family protein [Ideonella sp.]MCC7458268.1 ferritin family protein [Nitrospira sp.]